MSLSGSPTVVHLIDSNVDTAYFRAIATKYDPSRYRICIGSMDPEGPLQETMHSLGVPTFSLNYHGPLDAPVALVRLARVSRELGANLIHAHCFYPTVIAIMGGRVGRTPVVFTRHHSNHNIRMGKRVHVAIDGWCARHADHVIAVSRGTREVMETIERVPATKISVVYNGMDQLRIPDDEEIDDVRGALGLENAKVCLVVGRLHEEKGHAVLLKAAPEVIANFGETVFLLAGRGPEESSLRREIIRMGLEDHVKLIGQRSDINVLVSLADLVVLPSLAESFGFAALEAISLGTPVVASRLAGLDELVSDGVTGILVEPGDSRDLARAVMDVLGDPGFRDRAQESGKAEASQFSAERMVLGYEDVYDRVLGADR